MCMKGKPFALSQVSWHEVSEKIATTPIEAALNASIDISSYGSGIKRINFTFLAVKPSNTLHPNEASFNRKTRTVELALGLSYEHVLKASKHKVLEMMASLFLVSLDLYSKWNIEDFNQQAFRKDIEDLFSAKGWLNQVYEY